MANKQFYRVEKAIEELGWNKGQLLEACYGKGYNGIDSAIPCNSEVYNSGVNMFYYATDCRNAIEFYSVVYLPSVLPSKIHTIILAMADIHNLFSSKSDLNYDEKQTVYGMYQEYEKELENHISYLSS